MTKVLQMFGRMGESFNPCFGGSYIMTIKSKIYKKGYTSFNPCFGGSYIMTHIRYIQKR